MRGFGDGGDVEDVALGVGDRFAEEANGVFVGGRAPGGRVARVFDETGRDAELGQGAGQEVDGAAVEGGGGDDAAARSAEGEEGQGLGGEPGGDQMRADAAFEGGDAGGDDLVGGVVQARVDRAERCQGEAVGGFRGVGEDEGGRLVDRDGSRAGDGVGGVPRLDLFGLEVPAVRVRGGGRGGVAGGHAALLRVDDGVQRHRSPCGPLRHLLVHERGCTTGVYGEDHCDVGVARFRGIVASARRPRRM